MCDDVDVVEDTEFDREGEQLVEFDIFAVMLVDRKGSSGEVEVYSRYGGFVLRNVFFESLSVPRISHRSDQ